MNNCESLVHPDPTQAEAVRGVVGLYNKRRLTRSVKSVIKTILKWRR
jgi:hypothetical protein